jgi:two-component system, NtrC family, sensor kinase
MRVRRDVSWGVAAAMALALGSILTFLYLKTQVHDASEYFANVALLRQLKQLDARWELDVLKSKMGINTNYDALVDPLVSLNQLREQLQTDMAAQRGAAPASWAQFSGAFQAAIEEKTRLIEHFKSRNSVLRNSLAFLPTAAHELEESMRESGVQGNTLKKFSATVNELLLGSLVFSQAPSDDKAADIQGELARLVADDERGPASVRVELSVFAAHVRAVLREQPAVNGLLSSIAAVPTAASIDALDNELAAEQREAELQTQQYRKYLLIFSAALAALFLYAAISLIRSHATINRVNRELQRANSTLEERVRERTRELKEAQSELMSKARQAGMAEIATNVLHNVGNVLNSVNVSASLVAERVGKSKCCGVARVAALLKDHAGDPAAFLLSPQGRQLPIYLHELAAELIVERDAAIVELSVLRGNVDHIKSIVAMQQSYASRIGVVDTVDIQGLVEDSLRMNEGAFSRHAVDVTRDFGPVPEIQVDKHKVLQILVNLIRNAKYACEQSRVGEKRVTVRLRAEEDSVVISVIDTGVGIPKENLSRIFNHGFTTRPDGHGFGLHGSALAARDLGGSLHAQSAGVGEGATFNLTLPLVLPESLNGA